MISQIRRDNSKLILHILKLNSFGLLDHLSFDHQLMVYLKSKVAVNDIKVGCVFPIVIVPILSQAELGPNDHREDASNFGNRMILNYKLSKCCGQYPKRNPFDTTRSECCEDSTIKPLGTC